VPTVLIADDNSNIQKMVTLALKAESEDIDVVAVGNGEAAIRKAREIVPDLVLADIFMPVRGGYEVCELVKQDTRLSHIPVVLLAGAFDPFDEPEARRVGADGVLKKPFVPAEPLVSLVKELLAKSSAPVLVPVAVQAEASAPAREISAPSPVPVQTPFEIPTPVEVEEEPSFKGFTLPDDQLAASDREGASAFSSVIEAAPETDAEEPLIANTEPGFHSETAQQERSDEFGNSESWSPIVPSLDHVEEAIPDAIESEPTTSLRDSFGKAWTIEPPIATRPEEETIVEPLDRFAAMHYAPPAIEQSKSELITEEPPATEGTDHDEFSHTVISREDWEPDVPAAPAPHEEVLESEPAVSTPWQISTVHETDLEELPQHPAPAQESFSTGEPEAEPEHAPVPFDFSKFEIAPVSHREPESFAEIEEVRPPASEEVAPESDAVEFESPAQAESVGITESYPVAAPAPMDPRMIEEIVSRVIDRMQPQLMEIINREILKPVVESLVRRQLDSE
jgi:CheY-like chemotaxis protein